jgi:imidazole glycerol-phosphate synthase subunit HisH
VTAALTNLEVAIVDYGAGNVTSVARALRWLGATPRIANGADAIAGVQGVVVPGVGHFARTAAIDDDIRQALLRSIEGGTPILGICLGMHWLFEGSSEAPHAMGLGIFQGRCSALQGTSDIKVPHVGWNAIDVTALESRLLNGIGRAPYAYFCHSYALECGDWTTGATHHGATFSAIVERDDVFGVQFHPEKSGTVGLQVLRNFLRVCGLASRPC